MERENINRGSGWLFMSLGRRLERSIYLTRELRIITRHLHIEDWAYLERLLEVADSSVTYRTRYYTTLQPLAVLDVLMADEDESAVTRLSDRAISPTCTASCHAMCPRTSRPCRKP